jgi:hypothetical protein
MKDPQSVALVRTDFPKDLKTVSYWFKLDGKDRIITYHRKDADTLDIDVRETHQGVPTIELRSTKNRFQARTPDGEFTLERGKKILPATTDELSVWLVVQNYFDDIAIGARALLIRAAKTLGPNTILAFDKQNQELSSGKQEAKFGDFLWKPFDKIIEWFGGGGDCLSPGQETTCTGEDENNNPVVYTCKCDCGTPICTTQSHSYTVPTLIYNTDTGAWEAGETIVTVVVCLCWCMGALTS